AALRPLREVLARRERLRPPGGLSGTTVRNGTAATANGRETRSPPKARPGAAAEITPPEMPRWSAERRAGRRHRPVIPGDPGIGPTARRVRGAALPHQRLSALCPPRCCEGHGMQANPAPDETTRAAERWLRIRAWGYCANTPS